MRFTKMQGLGNDFIFIEDFKEEILQNEIEIAKKVCNRRFGIGADGLIVIRKSEISDAKMIIINSDGSYANMCGNATRCFAKYIYENKLLEKDIIKIETGDGIKEVKLIIDKYNKVELITVNMGKASFKGEDIPLKDKNTLINEELEINNKKFKLTSLLMGVPHTIIIDNKNEYLVEEGEIIEKYDVFTEKTNVNFVKIINDKSIEVRTWERGAGATLACGTGCCASVVALNKLNLINNKVKVITLGGELLIQIINDNVYMTGKAEFICRGEVLI